MTDTRTKAPFLLAALLLLLALPAAAQTARADGLAPADSGAIARLAAAGDTFWNDRDAAGISGLYTEDAHNWMVGTEMNLRGRDAVRAYFTRAFAARGPGLRHRTVLGELQQVAPGVVVADGDVCVEQTVEGAAPRVLRRYTMSAVAVRGADGWRIRVNRVHAQPLPAPAAARP